MASETPKNEEPVDSGVPFDFFTSNSENKKSGDIASRTENPGSSYQDPGTKSPLIPMEFMHLQKQKSTPESRPELTSQMSTETKRRSSRAIKRKRFDDEIIDTASPPPPTPTSASISTPGGPFPSPMSPIASTASSTLTSPAQMKMEDMPSTSKESPLSPLLPSLKSKNSRVGRGACGKGMGKVAKSKSIGDLEPSLANSKASLKKKSGNKKNKRTKREGPWKDLSRWKPTDDLALITSVLQTHDLASVYRGIKFTCHFTLSEIQERWNALMNEPVISKMAIQAIKNLHPEVVLSVQRKALFSPQEQELLGTIKAATNPPPGLKDFEVLLKKNPNIFHAARTPRCLACFWQSLKQYNLLPDQSVQPMPKDNHILNFLDAEANINDGELFEEKDEAMDHELKASDRKIKKEIRHLEAEVIKWQILVDKVRGDNPPDFDNQTLAVLRGRLVRYLMRSKEITLGRTTKDQAVDVDLKLEGPAWKISRKQGVIKLQNSGEFFIANEGKRCIFVDGKPITLGGKAQLCNNSVLEIAGLKFVFLINQDLIEAIRQEAMKVYQSV